MIASNYRKFPEAMALQLVLVFGRCTWHTARPTTRLGRAVRAARAVLVKATPQLVRWGTKATPAWFKQAKRAARELANQVREACELFVWDLVEVDPPASKECAKAKVMELMNYMKKNFGSNMYETFQWPMRTSGKYQAWTSHGMKTSFWKVEKLSAYRDDDVKEEVLRWHADLRRD